MTADQIYLLMKADFPRMALATVYNNLKSLCEEQKIRKITLEGQPDRYERSVRHDHLVCRRCGGLSDITLRDLTETLRSQTGLEDFTYDLRINYLCQACRSAANPKESRSEQLFDNK